MENSKRTIKFRAWDNDNNKMLDWEYFREYHTLQSLFNSTDFSFMQFTGLTDKNGKEIYEMDIVKDEAGVAGEVMFREDKAQFVYVDHKEKTTYDLFSTFEVIGNVWENPGLLQEKDK